MAINSGRKNIRPTLADHRWMILSSTSYLFASMYDDTRIFANGSLADTLNKQEIKSISLSANDIISSNRPISFSRSGSGLTGIAYAWEGNLFAHRVDRYNISFYIVATRSDASVEIEDSRNLGSNYFSGTVSTSSFTEVNIGDTNSQFIIRSLDNPIAVYAGQLTSNDCMPLYPCTTELFGTASNDGHMIATEDNTTFTEFSTSGGTTTRTLNKGDQSSFTYDASSQFSGQSVRLVADKPIAAFSQADSDGGEVTPFGAKDSFGKKFVIPENEREFVKLVSDVPAVATAYDTSGNVLSTTTLAGSDANGVYNARLTGTSSYEGVLIETDQPVYAIYEGEADDETVLPAHYPSEFEVAYSPKIVRDGLVLALDAANPKCFTPGETTCRNLVTGGLITGASGTPGSGSHSPNPSNFPSYNAQNSGVFDFAGGKGMNCEEDFGSSGGVLTLIMCFYKNSSSTQYFSDARNDGGRWFLSNYSGENINYDNDLRYNFDASYDTSAPEFINQWIHMAVVSDGSGSLLYLNGYEISNHPVFRQSYVSTNSLDEDLGRNFRIGTRYTTSSEWTGLMGAIYAYQRTLSAEEIYQNFSSLRGRYGI